MLGFGTWAQIQECVRQVGSHASHISKCVKIGKRLRFCTPFIWHANFSFIHTDVEFKERIFFFFRNGLLSIENEEEEEKNEQSIYTMCMYNFLSILTRQPFSSKLHNQMAFKKGLFHNTIFEKKEKSVSN